MASMVDMSIRNSTEKKKLSYFSQGTGNLIDDCWRGDHHWIWVSELRLMLHEADDCVNDFMIKVYGQIGRDQKKSIVEFRSELENVNSPPAKQSQLHANCLSIKASLMHGHSPMYYPKVHVSVIILILQLLMSKFNLSKLQSLNLILKTSILKYFSKLQFSNNSQNFNFQIIFEAPIFK